MQVFRPVGEAGSKELQTLVEQIALRIDRTLEQRGLIERDVGNARLAADTEAGPLDDLIGHSINYRVVMGARPRPAAARTRAGDVHLLLHAVTDEFDGAPVAERVDQSKARQHALLAQDHRLSERDIADIVGQRARPLDRRLAGVGILYELPNGDAALVS